MTRRRGLARTIRITEKGYALLALYDSGLARPLSTLEARRRAGQRQARINNLKAKRP